MAERTAEDRSLRLRALGLLASLCPPGDEEETILQLELREQLLDDWPTPILVEACRRLAKTWTWRKMPLPGDIDRICHTVRRDCRRYQKQTESLPEYMPLQEAKALLQASLSRKAPTSDAERLAESMWRAGLKARISLGEKPQAGQKQLADGKTA